MRILVTGAAGFIGSNFVHYLLDETDSGIISLDALTYAGRLNNLNDVLEHPRHEFVEGDIRDRDLVSDLLVDADAVVNFAAESHVDRSIEGSGLFVSTNIKGVAALLDAAVDTDLKRFVQVSTDEVYGEIEQGRFSEDDRLDPRNPYAATKAGADLLALSYYVTHGVPVAVTRSSNNFGPRQHEEKLVPKLITRAVAGEPLPIYGDGSNVREWLYVGDNCSAIDLVLREGEPGEVYNVGSGTELTNLEVVQRIVERCDASEDLIEFVEDRPGHDQRYSLDSSKVRTLGWEPKWTFDAGLDHTISYYTDA